jgi:amino acid adenylation domain-containing protein
MPVLRGAGSQTAILAPGRLPLPYLELNELVSRVGGQLRAAGISRDDRVALITPNGPEAATAFLAIAGVCQCAPLNPSYRDAELAYYLEDLRPKLIVHADAVPPAAAASAGICTAQIRIDPSLGAGSFTLPDLPPAQESAGDDAHAVALLLHTSGTTSRPKLVPLTWTNLLASADNVSGTLQLTPADRCLNVMPLFHIHGLVAALLSTLRTGGSIVCTPGLVATSFFDWMDEFTPTWYSAVPTMHQSILARAPRHPASLQRSRLRFVRSSSAPLPVTVLHELESTFGVPVIEAYGMTEAAHQMTSNPLPPGIRRPGSVGRAAGPQVTVLNNDGAEAGAGVEGHVCIHGSNVTGGYLDNAGANAEAFKNGWFYTGDLGHMDADGYLFLTGRSKEIINRGGEKISPREVDEVLMAHPAVRQCLTFALPDSQLGEEVGVVVVSRDQPVSETELQHFAAARLADFKVPRRVLFLETIPTGPTGKLQRVGLAQRLGITTDSWKPQGPQTSSDADVAETVARIMAEVLDVPSVDPQIGFFDAGGDSVLATRLLIGIEGEFKKKLTLVDLFSSSSPSAIAAALAEVPASATIASTTRTGGEVLTLSTGQVRLWLHGLLAEHNLAAQTPRLFEIRGRIEPEQVRVALLQIVNRHEPLRTIISNDGGVPRPRLRSAEPLPWTFHDWTSIPVDHRETSARELCLRDAAQRFRLDTDLPLRATLHKLTDDRWWLLLSMHHAANDGWSAQVLRRELQTLLEGVTLPALPASYSDFARAQQGYLESEQHAANMKYWAEQLDGLPPLLELPTEFARPRLQTYSGATVTTVIPLEVTEALREVSRSRRVTLFMSLLATWTCLLSRYAASTDICIGTPVAGRKRPEFEPLIGLFANTLVLRLRLDGTPTFADVLDRVRTTCLEAWEHDVPFEQLLQELPPERNAAHSPYFQVYFQLRNFPRATASTIVPVTEVELDFDVVATDLNLEITETSEGLRCRLAYNEALFTNRFAAAMLRHFEVLLGAAIAQPDCLVSELPLMTSDEQAAVVRRSQGLQRPRAEATVVELFERQARERSGDIAILHRDRRVTYGELNAEANRQARVLTGAGVGPEQVVALCIDRSADWVTAMIAVAKAGAAYFSIDSAHPAGLVRELIERARVSLVIADERWRSTLADIGVRVIFAADLASQATGNASTDPPLAAAPHNLSHLFFTSGSTGRPKGIATEHRNLSAYLHGYQWMPFAPSETCLQFTSASFDPCAAEVWGPLTHGGRCAVYAEGLEDVGQFANWLRDAGVTMCFFSSSVFNTLIDEAPEVLLPVRRILVGGEALSVPHVRRALELLPQTEIINGYGPTETTIYFTGYRVARPFDWQRSSVPIGRPLDNGTAYVLDGAGKLLPEGLPGDLWLGGDSVGRGYLHDADATAAAFVPTAIAGAADERLYRTGDRARWRPDGQLEFLGRTDHQVKIRGVRIELGEIEAVLREHAAVRHAVVVATPHAQAGNVLSAFVELQDGAIATSDQLRTYLSERLIVQMVPTRIDVLASLPLNSSGKIDRQILKRRAVEARDSEPARARVEALQPSRGGARSVTAVERRLANIWGDLLGVSDVSPNDDFFALGGHSLLAVRLAFQVEREFGRPLTLAAMFEASTLAAMAALVAAGADSSVSMTTTTPTAATLPPLLCVGAGPLFRPFADALAPNCLFQPVPTPVVPDETTMEDLAARIVPTILDLHRSGPVILAGWSLAGVVSIEVAAQLERAGREVSAVVLFDTLSPVRLRQWFAPAPRLRQWQLNAIKAWYHVGKATQHGPTGAARYLVATIRDARDRRAYDRLLRDPATTKRDFDAPLRFKTAFGFQAARYVPSPLKAPLVMVRPERRKRGALFAGDLGWRELGYQVEVLTVPGDHEQMFARPNSEVLAARVLSALRRTSPFGQKASKVGT